MSEVLSNKPHFDRGINSPEILSVRILIWWYFWLIIFEGALRKWVLPAISDYLLVIRDPLVLLIYFQAIRGGFFPRTKWVAAIGGLMVFFLAWGVVQAKQNGYGWSGYVVAVYGVRTFFLHFPLIFLMARVLSYRDVLKIGRWIMVGSVPMVLLMAFQYWAPDDSLLNQATVGEGAKQIAAAMGRIRPPGTFSFITGPMHFFPWVVAFAILGFCEKKTYPFLLILISLIATVCVLPISGSRSLVLGVAVVFGAGFCYLIKRPSLIPQFILISIAAFIALICFSLTPTGKESIESFVLRWDSSMDTEGQGQGTTIAVTNRFGGNFTEVFEGLNTIPFHGMGIGIGTNVGGKLIMGSVEGGQFLAGEGEWIRIVTESGIVLGFVYIIFRIALAFYLLYIGWSQFRGGNLLPWLLAPFVFIQILVGQTGPPTNLGMMVFGAGLLLASVQVLKRNDTRSALN